MKRIIIFLACAALLLPASVTKAAPVQSSPIGISATDGNPIDQILDVLREIKNIKEELTRIQADTNQSKSFANQSALDAATKVFEQLLKLADLQERYGSVPFTEGDRTKLTDFFVQNYSLLSDSPLTSEVAQEIRKQLDSYDTIGELIAGLVSDL